MYQVEANDQQPDYFIKLEKELLSLIDGESDLIANLANISSWINHSFSGLNWCGFYLWKEADQELVLGPFQGKPACIRIKAGRGVCGSAYSQKQTILVDDVHAFPGHIACDSASASELVVPLMKNGKVMGVLDLDSPTPARFTEQQAQEFERIMILVSSRIFN